MGVSFAGNGSPRRYKYRFSWNFILLVATVHALLRSATPESDAGASSAERDVGLRGRLPAEQDALSFADVLELTVKPWEDLTSVGHFPQSVEQQEISSVEGCINVEFPSTGAKPNSIFKLQLQLRHMNFLDDCARARQPDAVFLGDSMVSTIGGAAWQEMCNLTGGCTNFGVQGQTVEELQYSVQQFTLSCVAPKAFIINLGADSILKGEAVRDIVPGLKRVVSSLRNHFCHSAVIVTGLLPIVERANYETYQYKNVDGGGNFYFAKIQTLNRLMSDFANGREGVQFVDCHDLFLDRLFPDNIDRLLLEDGVHMSQPGQHLFARCVREAIQEASALPKVNYGRSVDDVEMRRDSMAALLRDVTGIRYAWKYSRWGPCSSCDNGGTQSRSRTCIRQDTGDTADNELCEETDSAGDQATRNKADSWMKGTALSRTCASGCPTHHWVPQPWGECSATCGGGTQRRQVVCLSSFGGQVGEGKCVAAAGPRSGFPTVQNCNTHSCDMNSACSSSADCPENAQCSLLRCDAQSAPACARWSTSRKTLPANPSADGNVRSEIDEYLRSVHETAKNNYTVAAGGMPGIPKNYESILRRVNGVDGRCDRHQVNDHGCISTPSMDHLPWYVRYHAYTAIRGWDTRRCYEYCRFFGKCVATDTNGACVSWECGSRSTCDTSRPTDFHVPSIAECLATGSCRVGGCSCSPGFTGPDCEFRVVTCPNGAVPSLDGCCRHSVAIDGNCCAPPSSLDIDGQCCSSGRVDACGICDGRGAAFDVLGDCCVGALDAAGRCCPDNGVVDECGVCNGDGSTCAFRVSGTLPTPSNASTSDVDSQLRRSFAQAATFAEKNGTTIPIGFITVVQGFEIDIDDTGKPVAAVVDFAIFMEPGSRSSRSSTGSDDVAVAAAVNENNDTLTKRKPIMLLADFEALLRRHSLSTNLTNVTNFRRSGICGNGICEVGESLFSGALVPGACREDCPFDDNPLRCRCGANGMCVQATHACLCRAGYTGADCSQCDIGFVEHGGQCIPLGLGTALVDVSDASSDRRGSSPDGISIAPESSNGRAISDPLVICLVTVTCVLFIALLCLVVYHVHWMRSNANAAPDLHQENPLNIAPSPEHSSRDEPKARV